MATGQINTYGPRRKKEGSAKSNSRLGGGKAPIFECGQNDAYPTKNLPGRFKVSLPHNRIKIRG